ncbi:MAG: ADP-heptose--LPS heptosyltransferase [Rhodospirillales bacterium 20-60-12]|nr:MAG: ADP-heptose--LPS heptosyltransferase [Rhodospirillales bacterium 20-60-12]
MKRVLVIKLGALGDIVLAFAAFAGIRAQHPQAEITLLTTRPFVDLLSASPWFDRIITDRRPKFWDVAGLLALRRQLRGFDMVYDLQTSARSSHYFKLAGSPPWSGIAKGCRFPHENPARDGMHTRERLAEQLAKAGIAPLKPADLDWLRHDPGLALPPRFAVLVPGAAPHRPGKIWPADRFGALAALLAARGLAPVVVGAAQESHLAQSIRLKCPEALDLSGKTSMLQLAGVIARAALAVGNDTGPMHLAAALNVPSLLLFSEESDPALTAPRYGDGTWPVIIRVKLLAGLSVQRVAASLP